MSFVFSIFSAARCEYVDDMRVHGGDGGRGRESLLYKTLHGHNAEREPRWRWWLSWYEKDVDDDVRLYLNILNYSLLTAHWRWKMKEKLKRGRENEFYEWFVMKIVALKLKFFNYLLNLSNKKICGKINTTVNNCLNLYHTPTYPRDTMKNEKRDVVPLKLSNCRVRKICEKFWW